jgi:hypothetical protein
MKHYEKIATAILSTAIHRGAEKSTFPSEIARMLFPNGWREHMKDVPEVALSARSIKSVCAILYFFILFKKFFRFGPCSPHYLCHVQKNKC